MENLQEKLLTVDLSKLNVMPKSSDPDPPTADLGSGPSGAVVVHEPQEGPADADDAVKVSTIKCNLPMTENRGNCNNKVFGKWDAFRKHLDEFHDKENWPEWPEGKKTKPVGYEHMEEGTGPMVRCWSVSQAFSSMVLIFTAGEGNARGRLCPERISTLIGGAETATEKDTTPMSQT